MVTLNENSFPSLPQRAVVNPKRCDGCAFCTGACPQGVIHIAANPDREGAKRIAVVSAEGCLGCGVCQATCPKEAITIPGLEPDRLRQFIRVGISMP